MVKGSGDLREFFSAREVTTSQPRYFPRECDKEREYKTIEAFIFCPNNVAVGECSGPNFNGFFFGAPSAMKSDGSVAVVVPPVGVFESPGEVDVFIIRNEGFIKGGFAERIEGCFSKKNGGS